VRNCADGRVEACFEGDADRVARMVAWCRHGPPQADVHEIEVFEEEPENAAGFFIR
jgi:acylphosphatase